MSGKRNRANAVAGAAGGRLALLGALLVGLAFAPQAAGAAVTSRVSTSRLQTLSHELLPGLGTAQNLGPLPASNKVLVAITVKQDLGALYDAEWAMYDPHSSTYHHFLTPAQWRAEYAPRLSQVAAIRAFGTSRGLTLVDPSRLYDYVELWGTVAQVESTFGVQLDSFKDARGQRFFANLQEPQVPAGLGIDAVLGLETFDHYHLADLHGTHAAPRTVTKRTAKPKSIKLTPALKKSIFSSPFSGPLTPEATTASSEQSGSQGACENVDGQAGVCTGLLSPQDLWNAYQLPTGPMSSGDYGQGQTIGLIGEGQTYDVIDALREFEHTRGLPFVPVQVYHTDPGENAPESSLDDSGRIEWEMDTQSSTGMAPEVSQVRLYFGSSLALTELTGAIGTWVNDPDGPLQVSASLGACEDTPAEDVLLGAAQRADQAFLIQAAMEGRTLFSSAGDTGTGCAPVGTIAVNGVTYDPYPGQEYPAIDPNTTAVGGTVLYTTTSGSRALERAWDHSGGGPSKFLPQPPYQAQADSQLLERNYCPGVYGDGTTSWDPNWPKDAPYLCRADVDVAAESGDTTIVTDHKVGDFDESGGYDPATLPGTSKSNPVEANGIDMVDFCPSSEGTGIENAAEPDCAYDGNGGKTVADTQDGVTETGIMTDDYSEGGTSLSSPLWLGMWARIQAHHDAGNSPAGSLGLANEVIYKLGSNATTDKRDFEDITVGANPLPATPGWDYPSGWGSPNVTPLIEDASGTPGSTAPANDVLPGSTDPAPLVAQVPNGPACTYAFYDGNPNAPDSLTGDDDENLALVQGTFGLSSSEQDLRVVMNLQNLSKTAPTGFTALDYEFYWTNPASDKSGPDAVDVEVGPGGNVVYADGTESVTTEDGESSYSFTPSSTSDATGTFGSGPDGVIEVDVPLSQLGLQVGDVLSAPSAWTAEDWGIAGEEPSGFIVDQQGPGISYTIGGPTCIDPGSSGSSAGSGSPSG